MIPYWGKDDNGASGPFEVFKQKKLILGKMSRLWEGSDALPAIGGFHFSPVVWANFGSLGRWFARLTKPEDLPLLIMSMPRSGSSWIGKMMGNAKSGLYLREPINQSILEHTDLPTLFDVPSENVISKVRPFARHVFAAYPAFGRKIVKQPERWSWLQRSEMQVIVKEVNPFFYPWLHDSFDFKTVYLVRHPAAVALSFHKLGWNAASNDRLSTTNEVIKDEHKDGFWSYHGALQAVASNIVREELTKQSRQRYRVVKYEDLCRQPLKAFEELFQYADLTWSEEEANRIKRHSTSTNDRREETYSTRRNSAAMIDAWREEITGSQYQALKAAYLHYEPSFYLEKDNWW